MAVLLGRLLMAGLLMVAGYKQVGWVQHRAYTHEGASCSQHVCLCFHPG